MIEVTRRVAERDLINKDTVIVVTLQSLKKIVRADSHTKFLLMA